MKRTVREILKLDNHRSFVSVSPHASVYEALLLLEKNSISALLVVENHSLRGIFSEKDFARATVYKGIQLTEKVTSFMTTKIYYAEPSFTLEDCMQIMSAQHIRHLPILESDKPIALLSMRHIMEALVNDQEAQIRDLTAYITGSTVATRLMQDAENVRAPVYSAVVSQEVL